MYRATLEPDDAGCTALRKLMSAAIDFSESLPVHTPQLTMAELDSVYELNAKLALDMHASAPMLPTNN